MSSIGGLSGSTSSSLSSLRGYGGLASGLDRDTLIENMTAGTTSKIEKQNQTKQKLKWEQEALRSITSKVYEFSTKYLSYASKDCLLNSKLYGYNMITALGGNADKISVSGSSSMAGAMSIVGIKQLARNATLNSTSAVSNQVMTTGNIANSLDTSKDFSTIEGSSILIEYGNKKYMVTLPAENDDYKYGMDGNNLDEISDSLNKAFKAVSIGNDKTLADAIQASVTSDGKLNLKAIDNTGNTVKLGGGTNNILYSLGILEQGEDVSSVGDERLTITSGGLTGEKEIVHKESKTLAEQFGGKQISFTYNGVTKWIEMPHTGELQGKTLEYLGEQMEAKLQEAFGVGRIKVNYSDVDGTNGQLSFTTTLPDGTADHSSVLSIGSSERGILGKNGALNTMSGSSNRLNMQGSLLESGLTRIPAGKSKTDILDLTVNGKRIYGLTYGSSVQEIINTINGTSGVGVKVSYQADSDRFSIAATDAGASGKIDLGGTDAAVLFGGPSDYNYTAGQDAVVGVKYEGSDDIMEVTRGSNTFTLNGLNITAKGTFGYDASLVGTVDPDTGDTITSPWTPGTEAITFDAQMDADKAAEIITSMVDDYNEIIKLINEEVSAKPNRDFQPLTSAQKEKLSEDDIKAWEEKAKKGILFGDTDVRGFADSLRFVIPTATLSSMEKMGITVSSNYNDHGKLIFDAEDFKAALKSDPDAVMQAFAAPEKRDDNGDLVERGGFLVTMQTAMERYASTTGATKGILIERAGSVYAPTSVLQNSIQKQLDGIDEDIERLKDKLETEQDRYIRQFTALEQLISSMNSQSSYLSSMFGG